MTSFGINKYIDLANILIWLYKTNDKRKNQNVLKPSLIISRSHGNHISNFQPIFQWDGRYWITHVTFLLTLRQLLTFSLRFATSQVSLGLSAGVMWNTDSTAPFVLILLDVCSNEGNESFVGFVAACAVWRYREHHLYHWQYDCRYY